MYSTRLLRVVLVLFLIGLALLAGVLYLVSVDAARNFPEHSDLRLPLYVAVAAGLVPFVVAVSVVFGLLRLVDAGEAFSGKTVVLLRRLQRIFTVTAGYLMLGLVGVWVALGQMHPSLLLAWLAVAVVVLFAVGLAGLLGRLFAAALQLREDNELTV